MSVFGDLDIGDIPDDPFYTPPNTYHCVCTKAEEWTKEGEDIPQIVITWSVDDPSSDYHNHTFQQYFKLFLYHAKTAEEAKEMYQALDGNEKKAVIGLKKTLRRGFDLSETEARAFSDPTTLIGSEAKVTVKESTKDKKTYTNVRDVVSKRLWEEEHSEPDEATASLLGGSSDL